MYDGNMNKILARVRNKLFDLTSSSSGSLYGIKQVKRGILPSSAQFPVITMTPENEIIRKQDSGRIHIERQIKTFIITRDTTSQDIENLRKYADVVHQALRDDHQLLDANGVPLAYGSVHSTIDYEDRTNSSSMQSIYFTEQCTSPRLVSSAIKDNSTANDIAKEIYTYLNGYKNTNLRGFKQILKEEWYGLSERAFPSLSITTDSETNQEYEAGREQNIIVFRLDIKSKIASASDNILSKHISLTDDVLQLLLSNATWNGTCIDSKVEGVQYGTIQNEEDMLYASSITLSALTRHSKPFSQTSVS
tara:strand:+ start:463 stop:1380 length:918 start_codon:yes stop_codon:yes gene_type:complete